MELFLAQAFNRFLDTNFVVKNLDGSNLELQKENSSGAEPISATSLAERERVVREKLSTENSQNTPKP